jgi:hypothetical protein
MQHTKPKTGEKFRKKTFLKRRKNQYLESFSLLLFQQFATEDALLRTQSSDRARAQNPS